MTIKKRIIISITGIAIIIISLIGFTYGFYMTRVNGNTSNTVVLEAGESELTVEYFESEDEYHIITPGYVHYKMFTVKNTGDVNVNYEIFLEDVVNEFVRTNDVTYSLYKKAYEGTVTASSNIFDLSNLNSCVEEPIEVNENYSNTCYIVSTNTFPTAKTSIASNESIRTTNYKYVYLLKYEYINSQENQDADKGHIFGGKVKVYGKDSAEATSPFEAGTLASKIIENSVNNVNGTIYSEVPLTTPGASITKTKKEKNNYLTEVKTQSNITTTNVFTYASDYTENTENGLFTLTNPTSDTFANIYSSLPGKYIVSYTGAASEANSEGITSIYKVMSTTSNSITYGIVSNLASDEKTLSKTEENGGYSYYYRGGVEDNYLNFNNMCWRIVRIDSTGGIKLILASQAGECSSQTLTYDSGYIKSNGSIVSRQFGQKTRTLLTPTGTDKTVTVQNFINSTGGVKEGIESWFNNINFDLAKLKQNDWCLGNLVDAYKNGVKVELTNEMVDGNGDQYASAQDYLLAKGAEYSYKMVTRNPSLNCDDVNDTRYSSYIGLLTLDELSFAGGKNNGTSNTFYLRDNALSRDWWTPTLSNNGYGADRVIIVLTTGRIDYGYMNTNGKTLRPSIVLKPGIEYVSGDGTIESPYRVEPIVSE